MQKTQHNNIDLSADSPGEVNPVGNNPSGEWMTVTNMGNLLGLKRTERYWLVHKNVFETKMILGKMRVNVASFEDWYSRQIRYHKVTGEKPGEKIREVSYSAQDIAKLLGISEDTAYALIKTNHLATETVNYRMRVPKELFNQWYSQQTRYLTNEDREKNAELLASSISMPQMARLLGISRNNVYSILRSIKYGGQFKVIVVAGKKRITKSSFYAFLNSQNKYQLIGDAVQKQDDPSGHVPSEASNSETGDMTLHGPGRISAGRLHDSEEAEVPDPESSEPVLGNLDQQTGLSSRQSTSPQSYLPISEAASLAGLSRQSVSKYADRGCFEMKKVAGKNWICRREFMDWLDRRKQEGGDHYGFSAKA